MRAPALRALGFLSAARRGVDGSTVEVSTDCPGTVLSLGRPESSDGHRRATRECLLALAAVEAMLEDGNAGRDAIGGERTGLVYATAAAYGASNRGFIEGSGSGIHFAYTAPSGVPAEVAIEFGVTGPYAIFLGGPPATLRAIWQAALWLGSGVCDRALVLVVEIFDEGADLYARAPRLVGRPMVEAAGCLWLEPGRGRLVFESLRGVGRRVRPPVPDGGEMFGCAPLAALDRWRRKGALPPLELAGAWRGEQARLVWDEGMDVGNPGVAR
jgi:beta-ketoacyl synthase-like protein